VSTDLIILFSFFLHKQTFFFKSCLRSHHLGLSVMPSFFNSLFTSSPSPLISIPLPHPRLREFSSCRYPMAFFFFLLKILNFWWSLVIFLNSVNSERKNNDGRRWKILIQNRRRSDAFSNVYASSWFRLLGDLLLIFHSLSQVTTWRNLWHVSRFPVSARVSVPASYSWLQTIWFFFNFSKQ